MGNIESTKHWLYDNVLFLNFLISKPETEDSGQAGKSRNNILSGKSRAHRFTPSHAKLENRYFKIFYTINDRRKEFLLKLLNDPVCEILLCDKNGMELKCIRKNCILYLQRKHKTIEAFFTSKFDNVESIVYEFEAVSECLLFCDSMRALFGIQVQAFGSKAIDLERKTPKFERKKRDSYAAPMEESSDSDVPRRRSWGTATICADVLRFRFSQPPVEDRSSVSHFKSCPIHGKNACQCRFDPPNLTHITFPEISSSDSEGENEIDAAYSDEFPVIIDGKCEIGENMHIKDISLISRQAPPRVIEWFVSELPGKSKTFTDTPAKIGVLFKLEKAMAGHYIKARVTRRLSLSQENPFVFSVAQKGPVTISTEIARRVLTYLAQSQVNIEAMIEPSSFILLFEDDTIPSLTDSKLPIFEAEMTLSRLGVKFALKPLNYHITRTFAWKNFYVTHTSSNSSCSYPMEDITLFLHFYSVRWSKDAEIRIRLPSEDVKDSVYHLVAFYKLQKKVQGFERWKRDLDSGNFSNIKVRYAELWSQMTAEDFYKYETEATAS